MHFQINTVVGLGFSYSCATSKVLPKYWLGNAFWSSFGYILLLDRCERRVIYEHFIRWRFVFV